MASHVTVTLVAAILCFLTKINEAQPRVNQKKVNMVCLYNDDDQSMMMYFSANYNGDPVDKVLAVNGRVYNRTLNNEAACTVTQLGADKILIQSKVYTEGTTSHENGCGGRRTLANDPISAYECDKRVKQFGSRSGPTICLEQARQNNKIEWTIELREAFADGVYRGRDRRYLNFCTRNNEGYVVASMNVYGEDVEEPATRVRPDNEMAVLQNQNGQYLRQPGGSTGIDIDERVKLQIRANIHSQYKDHFYRYGLKALACERSISPSFTPGSTFMGQTGCPPANNVFGLTRGFQRSAANIQPGGTYDIETEAFVFQSGVPQSHQYFVGCYLDYCYGNYSADDDDCQFSCQDDAARKKRSISSNDLDRVVLTVNINMDSTSQRQDDAEATRVVLITVSSVLAAVIICVICVIVVLLCLTKRRKYRSDDSISDVSSMDLPVKANIKA